MALFISELFSLSDDRYLMSLGRQCPWMPVRASGISMFHFVLQAFLTSLKPKPDCSQIMLNSSANAICT